MMNNTIRTVYVWILDQKMEVSIRDGQPYGRWFVSRWFETPICLPPSKLRDLFMRYVVKR